MRQQLLLFVIPVSLLPSLARAYSFQLLNQASQCKNVTFQVTGSGSPPYSLLMVPFGSSTLANNVEVRKIQNLQFPSGSTKLSVQLIYPADTQFVAVLSDSSGFGTGGTSTAFTVDSSSDASCYDATQSVQPAFYFSINPLNQLVQCQATRIWWDNSNNTIQGTPNFQGVIPGGQSFTVPVGTITNVTEQGTGFSWTPTVRAGSTVILVGGDDRGMGDAGSSVYIVSNSTTNDNSCLSSDSPSSTPGTPAGSYATGTSGSGSNGNSSGGTSVGAIAGGVVGGIAGILIVALLAVFYMRRRRSKRAYKERPALFTDHDDDAPGEARREDLPLYYEPEPFTLELTDGDQSTRPSTDHRQSQLTYLTDNNGRATPDGGTITGSSRKSPLPPSLRPVNVIQHEDAGPSTIVEGQEPETVELPPAYTNIRS